MVDKRDISDAKKGKDGTISHILFKNNKNYTKIEKAIEMVNQGKIELGNAHVVRTKDGNSYLRTNPDRELGNNLSEMAKD